MAHASFASMGHPRNPVQTIVNIHNDRLDTYKIRPYKPKQSTSAIQTSEPVLNSSTGFVRATKNYWVGTTINRRTYNQKS